MALSLEEFLQRVEDKTGDRRKKHGKYYTISCPGHDDNKQKKSLSVQQGDNGGIVFKCHANCEKGTILDALGIKWVDVMPPTQGSTQLPNIYEQDGITFPGKWDNRRISEAYIYRDLQEKPLFAVLRTQPKGEFPQGRIEGQQWKAGLAGVERVLYDLPELVRAKAGGISTVYLPEGEKDVKAIQRAGGTSTCNNGGAGAWDDKFNHFLQGMFIVIIRDKDGPGKDHARKVAASLRRSNIPYKIVESASGKDAYDHLDAGYNLDEFIDVEEDPYKFLGGKTFRMSKDQDGKVKWTCLSNFEARIVKQCHIDGGLGQPETYFHIEGKTETATKAFEIRAAEFPSLSWAIPNLGAKAIIQPGQTTKEYLRAAIQTLSDPTEHTIYAQSGWRMIDDKPTFITNAGGITAEGLNTKIEVDLDRVQLKPLSIEPREGYAKALFDLQSSLAMQVWVPLIGTVFLAPLRAFVDPDFALIICGESGRFKSELAAIAQSFYGGFKRTNLPANFDSTDNFVELVLHAGKDCVIVVDDYYPANDRAKAQRLINVLDRILRGVGNSSARGRLNSNSQARQGYTPKAIPIITAEKLPTGQSNMSRAYIVEMDGPVITAEKLTDLQHYAKDGLFAGAMYDFLQWVAANWEDLSEKVPEKFEAIRANLFANGHRRAGTNAAWVLLGVWIYTTWLKAAGHVADSEFLNKLAENSLLAVKDVAEQSVVRIEDNSYPTIFIEALREGMLTGSIHLASRTGGTPIDAQVVGWRYEAGELKAGGKLVGYTTESQIWLLPDAAFSFAVDHCKRQETIFGIDKRTLFNRLLDRGYATKTQDKGSDVVTIQSKPVRVWRIPYQVIIEPAQEALAGTGG